jgi:hypothetical protein
MAGSAARSGAPAEHIGRSRSALASARATTRSRDVAGPGWRGCPLASLAEAGHVNITLARSTAEPGVPMVSDHLVLKATA